jgi:hypothetical protein
MDFCHLALISLALFQISRGLVSHFCLANSLPPALSLIDHLTF